MDGNSDELMYVLTPSIPFSFSLSFSPSITTISRFVTAFVCGRKDGNQESGWYFKKPIPSRICRFLPRIDMSQLFYALLWLSVTLPMLSLMVIAGFWYTVEPILSSLLLFLLVVLFLKSKEGVTRDCGRKGYFLGGFKCMWSRLKSWGSAKHGASS